MISFRWLPHETRHPVKVGNLYAGSVFNSLALLHFPFISPIHSFCFCFTFVFKGTASTTTAKCCFKKKKTKDDTWNRRIALIVFKKTNPSHSRVRRLEIIMHTQWKKTRIYAVRAYTFDSALPSWGTGRSRRPLRHRVDYPAAPQCVCAFA